VDETVRKVAATEGRKSIGFGKSKKRKRSDDNGDPLDFDTPK
jgi:hypothetical protein